jgi:hypothetical protein
VDLESFSAWYVSFRNLAHKLGPAANVWSDQLGPEISNRHVVAASLLGALRALKRAIEEDLLNRVEDLVAADAFDSLLEQADELFSKGYVLAAGVLGRAILEEHLRKLSDRHACLPSGRPTIGDLNQLLYKEGHFDKLLFHHVTAMAAVGNDCAHNNPPPAPAIRVFVDDVRRLLLDHPLP